MNSTLDTLVTGAIDGMGEKDLREVVAALYFKHPYMVRNAIAAATGRELLTPDEQAGAIVFEYIHEHDLYTSLLDEREDSSDYDRGTIQYHLGVWQAALNNADAPDGFRKVAEDQIQRWSHIAAEVTS